MYWENKKFSKENKKFSNEHRETATGEKKPWAGSAMFQQSIFS